MAWGLHKGASGKGRLCQRQVSESGSSLSVRNFAWFDRTQTRAGPSTCDEAWFQARNLPVIQVPRHTIMILLVTVRVGRAIKIHLRFNFRNPFFLQQAWHLPIHRLGDPYRPGYRAFLLYIYYKQTWSSFLHSSPFLSSLDKLLTVPPSPFSRSSFESSVLSFLTFHKWASSILAQHIRFHSSRMIRPGLKA